jgi:hypothetical protein
MHRNANEQPRSQIGIALAKLALITFVALAASPLASGTPKKDKDNDSVVTQVFQHTYDEVFQASQEVFERLGWLVTDKNKDKGTIRGNTQMSSSKFQATVDIHIEALNNKPETQVTMTVELHNNGLQSASGNKKLREGMFLAELQKVLSTYH